VFKSPPVRTRSHAGMPADVLSHKTPHLLVPTPEAVEMLTGHEAFRASTTPIQLLNKATDPFLPGVNALLALTVTANALGGATPAQRVFLALPAALFGFLVEARTRLALYTHRAEHGDDRIPVRLWARHPVRAARAWLWLARQSAPAFDRASASASASASAEHDRLRAARHAVTLALPGHNRPARKARALVARELNAGRLPPAAAVAASGLLTRPGVPALHRAALAAALGALPATIPGGEADTVIPVRLDAAPDGRPDPTPDGSPDGRPDEKADGRPDEKADGSPDTAARSSRRSGKAGTAAAVARLRDRHPSMTAARIGQKLGVSERTVRRHLAPRTGPPEPGPAPRGRRPAPPAAPDGRGGR
jgi:HTH domain